jgi:hypothetical protein
MKPSLSALAAASVLALAPMALNAQPLSVVLLLRTYTSPQSADEPCLHAGRTEAELPTLRLTCPTSVHVEARANTSAGWTLTQEQMTAGSFVLNHFRLNEPAGNSTEGPAGAPMELLLSW